MTAKYGSEEFDLWINVGVSKYDEKNHIYSITNKKGDGPINNDVTRPVGNAPNPSLDNSIPNSAKKVNSEGENNENTEADNEQHQDAHRRDKPQRRKAASMP